jgi:hypothetical protein
MVLPRLYQRPALTYKADNFVWYHVFLEVTHDSLRILLRFDPVLFRAGAISGRPVDTFACLNKFFLQLAVSNLGSPGEADA